MKRLINVQFLLWIALILALVGSLRHVAWGFSTLERGDLLAGYVQAIAVDLGLFGLAIGITERRRQMRPTLGLWAGVVLFSLVSTYANLLHGLHFATDIGLDNWTWLVSARPVVLSSVLPMLVIYLSEVAGDDRNYTVKLAEREAKRQTRNVSIVQSALTPAMSSTVLVDTELDNLTLARTAKAAADAQSKTMALDTILAKLTAEPNTRVADLARLVGKSRTTVYAYLDELEATGRLRRNGHALPIPDVSNDTLKEAQ